MSGRQMIGSLQRFSCDSSGKSFPQKEIHQRDSRRCSYLCINPIEWRPTAVLSDKPEMSLIMGIFGIFGRKSKADRSPSPDTEPRCHHYALAHYVIRQALLEDPLRCLALLASEDSQAFLEFLFNSACELCSERTKEKPDFQATDVHVHRLRVTDFPCVIIEMPRPIATSEAFFTALVAYIDRGSEITPATVVPARYFTLEQGFNVDENPRTVLCEWTTTNHVNYGDGPKPTIDDFANSLAKFGAPKRE
jgi:hypothetical protein